MKKALFLILLVFSFLAIFVGSVAAQAKTQEIAKKYGIKFPIKELGGCVSFEACQTYCDQMAHYDECIVYAKSKGFYKEEVAGKDSLTSEEQRLLALAKKELGCTSVVSCTKLCEQPVNQEKCKSFAQKHGLEHASETPLPSDDEIMKAAKEEFGCDSEDSCWAFCEQEANWSKCEEFATRHNLGSGDGMAKMRETMAEAKKTLGCDSPRSCMTFCSNPINMQRCQEFFSKMGFDTGGSQGIPCQSAEECDRYCKDPANRDRCRESGYESPEEWCPKQPGCKWTGSQCECEMTKESCSQAAQGGQICTWDGSNCTCWNPDECAKWPGCTWTGSKCDCASSYTEESIGAGCDAQPGCKWTGTTCECSEVLSEPPEVWCPKAAQTGQVCSWDGSSCTCWDPKGCEQNAGCRWTGSSCECTQENWCKSQPGCTWTGIDCTCGATEQYVTPSYSTPVEEPGEVWCPRNPDCTWTGTSCQCTPVQVSPSEPTPASQVQGAQSNYIVELDLVQILGRFLGNLFIR